MPGTASSIPVIGDTLVDSSMPEGRASRRRSHRWHRKRVEVASHDVKQQVENLHDLMAARKAKSLLGILLLDLLSFLVREAKLFEGKSLLLLVLGEPLRQGRYFNSAAAARNTLDNGVKS